MANNITGVISPNNTLKVSTSNDVVSLEIAIKENSGLEIYNNLDGTASLRIKISTDTNNLLGLNSEMGLFCNSSTLPETEKLISDITSSDNSLNIISNGVETNVGKKITIGLNISNELNNTLKIKDDGLFVDMPSFLTTQTGSTSDTIGIWVGNAQPATINSNIIYFW